MRGYVLPRPVHCCTLGMGTTSPPALLPVLSLDVMLGHILPLSVVTSSPLTVVFSSPLAGFPFPLSEVSLLCPLLRLVVFVR